MTHPMSQEPSLEPPTQEVKTGHEAIAGASRVLEFPAIVRGVGDVGR